MILSDKPTGVPLQYIPDIVHECVHHWCFNSSVGNALFLLRHEIMERSLEDKDSRILRILLGRYLLVTELLRPVAEGLACFAEFDVFPGGGNLRAAPLVWISIAAEPTKHRVSDSGDQSSDLDAAIARLLTQLRQREDTARRKEALLIHPLDPQRGDGYLLGYMLIKGFQRLHAGYEGPSSEAIERSRISRDSELLLSYYKAFFFNDAGLATLLLRRPSTTDALEDITPIREQIRRRFDLLTDRISTASRIAIFNSLYDPSIANPNQELSMAHALAYDSGDTAALISLAAAIEDRFHRHSKDKVLQMLRADFTDLIATKEWLCFASVPGRVVIKDHRLSFYDNEDNPIVMASDHGAEGLRQYLFLEDCQEEASMECWISPLGNAMIVILGSDRGMHFVHVVWGQSTGLVEEFLSSAKTNYRLLHFSQISRNVIDKHLAAQYFYGPLDKLIQEIVAEDTSNQVDLAIEMFSGIDKTRRALWSNGFADVLALPVLQAAAALGLLQSVEIGPSDGYVPEESYNQALIATYNQGFVEGGFDLVDYDAYGIPRILI
jgi:hypothetical protein